MTLLLVDLALPGGGRPAIAAAAVRIEHGSIAAVGTAAALGRVRGEAEMRLDGCTLLPGLIDAHDHLHGERRDPDPGSVAAEPVDLAIVAAAEAMRHLERGITTVRVLGTPHGIDVAISRAVRAGVIPGPELIVAGRALTWPGGPSAFGSAVVADAPAAVRAVEEQAAAGAAVIKLMASGGIASEVTEAPGLPVASMLAAIRSARALGLRVAAHAIGPVAIRAALDAGVDTIEHGIGLDEELARRMAGEGVALVPTITTYRRLIVMGGEWGLPDAWIAKARSMVDLHVRSVQAAIEANVTVATGSDGFGDLIDEIDALVGLGWDLTSALDVASAGGAAACGRAADRGLLLPGYRADLVAVEGDPRRSTAALRRIRLVVLAGVLHGPGAASSSSRG